MSPPVTKFAALKARKSFLQFAYNRHPICPHCGEEFDIDRNEAWRLYDDNDRHDVTCPSCDEGFQVESHCSWTFSTENQEDEDNDTGEASE